MTYVTCPNCGAKISVSNIQKHLDSHANGNWDRQQNRKSLDHDDPHCKYCGKEYSSRNALIQHEIRCLKNPDRIKIIISPNLHQKGRTAWNKGLTKYTDPRVARQSEVQKSISDSKTPHTELSDELDDNGKLYKNYKERLSANKSAKHKFLLTYEEFCILLKEAGIKSSDLGYSGNNYDLARYGDQGDYTFGNCRFITHKENLDERMYNGLTEKERREIKEKEKQEVARRKLERDEKRKQKQEEYQANKDTRYSNEHCSSYGTHWITNGMESRKWRPWKEEIPEGWYLGRTVKSPPVV